MSRTLIERELRDLRAYLSEHNYKECRLGGRFIEHFRAESDLGEGWQSYENPPQDFWGWSSGEPVYYSWANRPPRTIKELVVEHLASA